VNFYSSGIFCDDDSAPPGREAPLLLKLRVDAGSAAGFDLYCMLSCREFNVWFTAVAKIATAQLSNV